MLRNPLLKEWKFVPQESIRGVSVRSGDVVHALQHMVVTLDVLTLIVGLRLYTYDINFDISDLSRITIDRFKTVKVKLICMNVHVRAYIRVSWKRVTFILDVSVLAM